MDGFGLDWKNLGNENGKLKKYEEDVGMKKNEMTAIMM